MITYVVDTVLSVCYQVYKLACSRISVLKICMSSFNIFEKKSGPGFAIKMDHRKKEMTGLLMQKKDEKTSGRTIEKEREKESFSSRIREIPPPH